MDSWNKKLTPVVKIPTRIDAAGTASITIPGGSVRALIAKAETAASQLRITIDGTNFDCVAGDGWQVTSPDTGKFVNDITLTALAGTFAVSTVA